MHDTTSCVQCSILLNERLAIFEYRLKLMPLQDLFPPLFAIVAASAEVSAARGTAPEESQARLSLPRLRQSAAGLAPVESAGGTQAYYAVMWAAGT